ncbi:cell filamentation protein Fic [Mesorhizobium sp. M1A.F.Ca.ET.072.01.1.1]|nr:cell filamentation protein Fic [Mesorhizobium sp. M1A.F.Ca.ET.072.01.1.1]TIU98890.1 MAG: cell filamentation protein Fic [Mesorhizobium sp.]
MPLSRPLNGAGMSDFPEFVLSTKENSLKVSRAAEAGKLREIGSRLYTTHMFEDRTALVRRNIWKIVPLYFPDAIVADRTALEQKPASDGSVFLIAKTKRDVELPGCVIRSRKGHDRIEGDYPMRVNLYCTSLARTFVENMIPSRSRSGIARTASRSEIETHLLKHYRTGGETGINILRDQIKKVGSELGLIDEARQLGSMIGALIGTQEAKLSAPAVLAHVSGEPYDLQRIDLFNKVYDLLRGRAPQAPLLSTLSPEGKINQAFFEAYFSNFIEGTEFELDEAQDIVFNGAIPKERPADAHDIVGTFEAVSDPNDNGRVPQNFDDFIELLKQRNKRIMNARPEKSPGQFKTKENRFGVVTFVKPEDVIGTLKEGFKIHQRLDSAMDRAIFMMFLVAEVHPFNDGNGRTARIMMNAELTTSKETRIIIPTVYRSNYLEGLRMTTNAGDPSALIRTLEFAQRYVHAINWSTLQRATSFLTKTNAFVRPEVGDREAIRLRLPRPEDDDGDGSGGSMSGGPKL